ncbi:MAG: ribbon-helix-helix protein, CopG family, partial [Verrucomicrobiota bacterium]|nr:ribbon-helix-helix protein, CopG family [Verrucomicrobiota bacterium]
MPEALAEKLARVATARRASKSEIFRQALSRYVDAVAAEHPAPSVF